MKRNLKCLRNTGLGDAQRKLNLPLVKAYMLRNSLLTLSSFIKWTFLPSKLWLKHLIMEMPKLSYKNTFPIKAHWFGERDSSQVQQPQFPGNSKTCVHNTSSEFQVPSIRNTQEIPIQYTILCKHSKNFLLTEMKQKLSPSMYLHFC